MKLTNELMAVAEAIKSDREAILAFANNGRDLGQYDNGQAIALIVVAKNVARKIENKSEQHTFLVACGLPELAVSILNREEVL